MANSEQTARKILPHLKPDYFSDRPTQTLYRLFDKYTKEYTTFPTEDALRIELRNLSNITGDVLQTVDNLIVASYSKRMNEFVQKNEPKWFVDQAESFCKSRALYNALKKALEIVDEDPSQKMKLDKGAIPVLFQDALSVCFDNSIGHDYIDNSSERFDYYHRVESKIPFRVNALNKITRGGFSRKTLNMFMAPTGIGKSMFMCSFAADALLDGQNVLYITCEMAEEKIAERIDANLLDVSLDQIEGMSRAVFDKRIEAIKKKTVGKLIIKEYPPAVCTADHIRALLGELKTKRKFVPTIIYLDYLNICASSRFKNASDLYTYGKSIAEEMRGLAVENDLVLVSATQTNRSGMGASDYSMSEISESAAVAHTVDFMGGIISTDGMEQMGQIILKQLKSRYGPIDKPKTIKLGIDRSKMRIIDVENEFFDPPTQQPVVKSKPKSDDSPPWDTDDEEENRGNFFKPPEVKPREGFDLMKVRSGRPKVTDSSWS